MLFAELVITILSVSFSGLLVSKEESSCQAFVLRPLTLLRPQLSFLGSSNVQSSSCLTPRVTTYARPLCGACRIYEVHVGLPIMTFALQTMTY